MKKLVLLSLAVAFALVCAQAFASPPVAPPPEGFIITTKTDISAVGDVIENESYKWTYFEGWGTGPFFPQGGGYTPAGAIFGTTCTSSLCPPVMGSGSPYLVSQLGFSEGAEIAYTQTFKAVKGTTDFYKTFDAYSHPVASESQSNLKVHKEIVYDATDIKTGYAEHTEKVGLSVISMGASSSSSVQNPAAGLLSLCPWAAQSGGALDKGYPATNEGIAAGSHFKVTNIGTAADPFKSDSVVESTTLPKLTYDVVAKSGTGLIEAGFVVDLWEAPEGFIYKPIAANTGTCTGSVAPCITGNACACNPYSTGTVYVLPQFWGPPPLASRTSYKEFASANGTWSFEKHVKYQSVMPTAGAASQFPLDRVLLP